MNNRIHGGFAQGEDSNVLASNVLDFSINVNPIGPPAAVKDAMNEAIRHIDRYPDPSCHKLCCALANYHGIESSQLICANGAGDLIFQVIGVLKPKTALCLAPDFSEYEQALRVQGTAIQYYELKRDNGFALDEAYLSMLKKIHPDLIVLVNPHNPTGNLIDESLLERIISFAQAANITVLLDECFIEFTDRESLIRRISEFSNLFLIRAFTKSFALPGLRLGYGACADEKLIQQIIACRQPWSVSLIAQEAGLAALKELAYQKETKKVIQDEQDYLKETKKMIRIERDYLIHELKKLEFCVFPSETNFILFQTNQDIYTQLMSRGICIRDCSNYRTLEQGFYRVAVKQHHENRQLIETLKLIINRTESLPLT
ncbi:MAG: aminotransferase class I/II-fold pyridoxal phosphate-dependent enzyme [Clostridia bacterium]|nr:aminotransferase class I/II-fold pyridoxal phosphate-dependent enzyme [Clostridia bacterium]